MLGSWVVKVFLARHECRCLGKHWFQYTLVYVHRVSFNISAIGISLVLWQRSWYLLEILNYGQLRLASIQKYLDVCVCYMCRAASKWYSAMVIVNLDLIIDNSMEGRCQNMVCILAIRWIEVPIAPKTRWIYKNFKIDPSFSPSLPLLLQWTRH